MGKTVKRRSKHTAWDNPETGYDKFIKDPQEWNACSRKKGVYSHEKQAMAHAANIPCRENKEQIWRAYECPWCKKWHLTNKAKK